MAQSPDILNAMKLLLERREALGVDNAAMPRNEREREVWTVAGSAGLLKYREQREARSAPQNEREREVLATLGAAALVRYREQREARQTTPNTLARRPAPQATPKPLQANLESRSAHPLDAIGALIEAWRDGQDFGEIVEQLGELRERGQTSMSAPLFRSLAAARGVDVEALDARDNERFKRQTHTKVYPSLWATARQRGLDNALRVYWLAYHLEPDKRGKLSIAALREALTAKGSELRAFGWRRLRQVLGEGEGVFWTRSKDASGALCLWRHSPRRVLEALDGGRMRGKPVSVSVYAIAEGKHAYSAAMLSAWHAGRDNGAPISQAGIRRLTDVAESTQRTYQKTAKIEARRNIALLGKKYTPDAYRAALYEHGGGVFVIRGKHGAQLARALPNSYTSSLEVLPRGRTRKINQHLVINAEQGKDGTVKRVYFEKPTSAAAAASRERRTTYAPLTETTRVNVAKKPRLERAQQWREYSVLG